MQCHFCKIFFKQAKLIYDVRSTDSGKSTGRMPAVVGYFIWDVVDIQLVKVH